jgi:hypothetical protein
MFIERNVDIDLKDHYMSLCFDYKYFWHTYQYFNEVSKMPIFTESIKFDNHMHPHVDNGQHT